MTLHEALHVLAAPPGQGHGERRREACDILYRAGFSWLGCDPRRRPDPEREEDVDLLADLLAHWMANGFVLGRTLNSDDAAKAYVLRSLRNRRLDRLEQERRFVSLDDPGMKVPSVLDETMEEREREEEARRTGDRLRHEDLPDLRSVVETVWAAVPGFGRIPWPPEDREKVAVALVRQLEISAGYFQREVLENGCVGLEPAVSWDRLVEVFRAYCFVMGTRMAGIESGSSRRIFAETFALLVRIRSRETTVTRLLNGSSGPEDAPADAREFARHRNRLYRRIHDLLKGLEDLRRDLLMRPDSLGDAGGFGPRALEEAKAWIDDLRVKARRASESRRPRVSRTEEAT